MTEKTEAVGVTGVQRSTLTDYDAADNPTRIQMGGVVARPNTTALAAACV
jgi:hypothetical protein